MARGHPPLLPDDRHPAPTHGGVIHTYQRYDPAHFPSPTAPPPDLASTAFEHMLRFGSLRHLSPEELADAVHLDPSQIAGLGPSLESMIQLLEERKRRILDTYETTHARRAADDLFRRGAAAVVPKLKELPGAPGLADDFTKAVREQQLPDFERLWFRAGGEESPVGPHLLDLIQRLGDKFEVEEMAARYEFRGRTPMDVPKALEIKEELEAIDRLLEQLREAMKNAKIAMIDMEQLSRFVRDADIRRLESLRQQVEDYLREQAALQGLEHTPEGYRLTPEAYRLFQGKLLSEIFSSLEAARSGRHSGPIVGEGAVELPRTRPYEFGDSAAHMDIPQTFVNALIRQGGRPQPAPGSGRIRPRAEDIEIHRTRNSPRCATAVIMDMSGSMRYDGQYVNAKRMALALHGLVRTEYPGDFLGFVEMYTFAAVRPLAEIPALMPKPVTVHAPVVRLKVDMSNEKISELQIPPHFTNIQHALRLSRRLLAGQDTPNRQIVLLTDGLPTAHFDGSMLYLLYPPDPRTEEATMREGLLCRREGITINVFLLPNWWQSSEDISFAHRLAEETRGRVFFTGGKDVDRFVLWDYVNHRRKIIG